MSKDIIVLLGHPAGTGTPGFPQSSVHRGPAVLPLLWNCTSWTTRASIRTCPLQGTVRPQQCLPLLDVDFVLVKDRPYLRQAWTETQSWGHAFCDADQIVSFTCIDCIDLKSMSAPVAACMDRPASATADSVDGGGRAFRREQRPISPRSENAKY